jgi:hypothetical protein
MIKIGVSGSRSDMSDWEVVQSTPADLLPPLTPEQRTVAEQLHIREEDYRRMALSSKRTAERLLKKTEWFAKILQRKVTEKTPGATVESVVFDTWDHIFQIVIRTSGTTIPLHIAESIVDDLFDLSSHDADQRLLTMLEESFLRLGVA